MQAPPMCKLSMQHRSDHLSIKSPKRLIFPEYWKEPTIHSLQKPSLLSPITPPSVCSGILESKIPTLPDMPSAITAREHLPFLEFTTESEETKSYSSSASIEPHVTSASWPIPQKRSFMPKITSHMSYSSPSLPTFDERLAPKTPPRRIVSGSHLEESSSSLGSCLRESRFSASKRSRSCSVESEGSSVRFDMDHVDVLHFEKPQECYSEHGWSEHFR